MLPGVVAPAGFKSLALPARGSCISGCREGPTVIAQPRSDNAEIFLHLNGAKWLCLSE
jgi:hypothetical protein